MPTDPVERTEPLPRSTYRLQLHAGFTFADAAAVVPRLARLGFTHLYLSPVLAHTPGSTHGYDVVDHSRVDPELGGREGLDGLAAAAHDHGLRLLVDIVPNHMSVAPPQDLNRAWWAVLSDGPNARTAHWFDIDWAAGSGRVVLPILAGPDDAAAMSRDGDLVRYRDHVLPADDSHYRLVPWREPPNYRRFFDVTSLAGLRVEDADVFDATHRLLLDLRAEGVIDGFRVDHPDGLANPRGYLEQLSHASGGAWTVVEKILENGEHLPGDWQCAGTTGYDALRLLDGVLLDPAGEQPLTELWVQLDPTPWPQVVEQCKAVVLESVLAPELERVSTRLPDPTSRAAMRELLISLPVYRTYLEPDRDPAPWDLTLLSATRRRVAAARPELAEAATAVVELLVTGADPELTRRFQQASGPVMAKAVEDTAMYRYHRLVALNEVGGDPGQWGVSLREWHVACEHRQRNWPETLNALSTHDTKRSHDVRARLLALSERTDAWRELASRALPLMHALEVPDSSTAYLALQTMVGAWPIDSDRLGRYLGKATREAKQHTSWTDPNDEYDRQLQRAVRSMCADVELTRLVADFTAAVAPLGRANAVSALALQLTMPGVPDVYQGAELEDRSLVDPDNRRPVDHRLRAALLAELDTMTLDDLIARADEGLPKLAVLRAGLAARRLHPAAFGPDGAYLPLWAEGPSAERVVAFARGEDAATVVSRLTGRGGDWGATSVELPRGRWRDLITGVEHTRRTPVSSLLAGFPVALLVRIGR